MSASSTTDEGEHAALFPALATCLQFSEAEVQALIDSRAAKRSSGWFGRGRAAPKMEAIDKASAEMALELSAKVQLRAQRSDVTAIAALCAAVSDLEGELEAISQRAARDVHARHFGAYAWDGRPAKQELSAARAAASKATSPIAMEQVVEERPI